MGTVVPPLLVENVGKMEGKKDLHLCSRLGCCGVCRGKVSPANTTASIRDLGKAQDYVVFKLVHYKYFAFCPFCKYLSEPVFSTDCPLILF